MVYGGLQYHLVLLPYVRVSEVSLASLASLARLAKLRSVEKLPRLTHSTCDLNKYNSVIIYIALKASIN